MNNFTFKEKDTTYRNMVIDLAHLYEQKDKVEPKLSLINDTMIAILEGGLATDTRAFTVNINISLVKDKRGDNDKDVSFKTTFVNTDGEILMGAWSCKGLLAHELLTRAGIDFYRDKCVTFRRFDELAESFAKLGGYREIAEAVVSLALDIDTDVVVRDFDRVLTIMLYRKSSACDVMVAFFKEAL